MKDKKKKLVGALLLLIFLVGIIYLGFRSQLLKGGTPVDKSGVDIGSENSGEKEDKNKIEENKDDGGGEENQGKDDRQDSKGDISFLLMGLDEGGRTDTVMVCKYFANSGAVSILSIPRDTRVMIEGRGMEKINHAHVYGGADLTLNTINNFLAMDIENYIRVDFKIVRELVDILGGVEVDVPAGMYGFEPGVQNLTGEEALEVIRHRASYSDQDLGRIEFQQNFLVGLIEQVGGSRKLSEIASMARSGKTNIDTNISAINSFRYIMKLRDVRVDKIETETLSGPHKMIDGLYYILVDKSEARQTANRLFFP